MAIIQDPQKLLEAMKEEVTSEKFNGREYEFEVSGKKETIEEEENQ